MNKFMVETELDALGRPVRSQRVYLYTFEEFSRLQYARRNMQSMLCVAMITDDETAAHVFAEEMTR